MARHTPTDWAIAAARRVHQRNARRIVVGRGGCLAVTLLLGIAGCHRDGRDVGATTPTARGVESTPRIELTPAGNGASSDEAAAGFAVVGLSADELTAIGELAPQRRTALLQVFVGSALANPPAMLGRVDLEGESLRFTPRYALEPGLTYRVVFGGDELPGATGAANTLSADFAIPRILAEEPTMVTRIYPSVDQLPENQLKFYLHFSAPMSRGQAYQHIHLFDAEGRELELPFLELAEELWDPDLRRFTLLCDPGRVKQGLKPHEELGAVLAAGQRYTLVVDRQWRDEQGEPLAADYEKQFLVLPADRDPIDITMWELDPPAAGTNEPLTVHFSEPLDHSLLERVVWVVDADGNKTAGTIEVGDRETSWRFTPQLDWSDQDYQLVAATTLEDLAGNSIGRAFEVEATHHGNEADGDEAGSNNEARSKIAVVPFRPTSSNAPLTP